MTPGTPPPGWYPNPSGAGPARWWDGTQWGAAADTPSDDRTELAAQGVTHGASGAGFASAPPERATAVTPRANRSRRPSKPMIIIGIIGIVLGVMAAVGGVVTVAQSDFIRAFLEDPIDGPGSASRTLTEREYTIYAEDPVRVNDITITGPEGKVDIRARQNTASITCGSETFREVAAFEVTESGRHRIEIDADAEILIVPSIASVLGVLAVALALFVASGLLVVVGVVLLLVGALRRAKPGAAPVP